MKSRRKPSQSDIKSQSWRTKHE